MTVDFPHPDGPINAVTLFFFISQNTFLSAVVFPYLIDTLSNETDIEESFKEFLLNESS